MAVKKKFILSDESVNSYGFRVLTSGIELSRFKKNPVMLLNHYENDVPGGWTDITVEDGKLVAVTNFDEKDEDAVLLANKVEQGFINGASIGFCILETSSDPALMLPGQTRPTVTKSILHEASITPLPSNSNALALYDTNGQKLTLDEQVLSYNKLSLIQNTNQPDMKLTAQTFAHLSLQMDASEAAIETAVAAVLKRATDAEKELSDIKAAQATELSTRSETLVQGAVDAKKITAAQKPAFLKMANADYTNTEQVLNSLKGAVQINKSLKDGEGETGTEDRSKWTLTDYRKKDPEALAQLKIDNKEAFDKLFLENK